MTPKYVVTGTLTDTRTITLDAPVPVNGVRVRVVVEEMTATPRPTMQEAVAEIRRRQQERGFVPMNTAQVEAFHADPPEEEEKDAA
ncbi:MAG TPA: hypothetical protein VHR66_28290 [Gemmataceae bacterium]|jgi:hypothetical protein|nr:hypothetical protein [Gemmataceae bacterium]